MLRNANGVELPLGTLANIKLEERTSQIKREMAKRRIVVGISCGIAIGGYVAELQSKVEKEVKLPAATISNGAASSKTWNEPPSI